MTNNSIFETHGALIAAAASYFGMPEDQVLDGEMLRADGVLCVTLRVALTPDDLVGIVKRMESMQAPDQAEAAHQRAMQDERKDWYAEWQAAGGKVHDQPVSWATYKAWRQEQEQMVSKAAMPEHVWLNSDEVTDYQRMMALSTDEAGRYAVSVDDLTLEQSEKRSTLVGAAESLREGYVARTVAATERLSGADGKPTSNADDFGGLPG